MKRKNIFDDEEHVQKSSRLMVDMHDLETLLGAALDFFSIEDMFALSHTSRAFRNKIDENNYSLWTVKWKQIYGNHKTISASSPKFQNIKDLCVYVATKRATCFPKMQSRKRYEVSQELSRSKKRFNIDF